MQARDETQEQSLEERLELRPSMQLYRLIESGMINYQACALKYERFNDDLDDVRKELQSLKRHLQTAKSFLLKYEEQRSALSLSQVLKSRNEVSTKKARQTEARLKEIQDEQNRLNAELKAEEELLTQIITMTEDTDAYKEFLYSIKDIDKLQAEKIEYEARRRQLMDMPDKKFLGLFGSNEKEKNELPYLETQIHRLERRIRLSEKEISKLKKKYEHMDKHRHKLIAIKEQLKQNDETFARRIQDARTEFEMAQAKQFMDAVEISRMEMEYYATISLDAAFALLRIYISLNKVNQAIEQTYSSMKQSRKVYLYNREDDYKNPSTRIKSLHEIFPKSQSKINGLADVILCADLGNKSLLEMYEVYKTFTPVLKEKFMSGDEKVDFKSMFELFMSDMPQDSRLERRQSAAQFFTQPYLKKPSDKASADLLNKSLKRFH